MSALTPAHRLYEGDAGRHYHEGKRALDAGALEWVVRARAQLFAGHIRAEHAVLEYGVGAGWNLLGLQCRRRVGIDVQCFLAPGWESRGIEFFPTNVSLPGGNFDVILCHHALEHVESPAATLTELLRLAKPGGHLLLAVGMTIYILIAIRHEERDLTALFGEKYVAYRGGVGMLAPRLRR